MQREYSREFHIDAVTWGLVGAALLLALGSYFTWGGVGTWMVGERYPLVGLCVANLFISSLVYGRLRRYPLVGSLKLSLVCVSMGVLLTAMVLTFGRFYYSRSFLTFSALFSIFWLWFGNSLTQRHRKPFFAVLPGANTGELLRLKNAKWLALESPALREPVDGIVVDWHDRPSPDWIRFFADQSLKGIRVFHSAVVYESLTGRVSIQHMSEPLLDEMSVRSAYAYLKRLLDILAVIVFAPLVLPVIAIFAILIRLDSPGPVFFWQTRVGHLGKPFRMVKLRSMRVSSEDPAVFAKRRDARTTRSGKLIRKLRIDELPQLWNILKGEMSLIGPRPEQVGLAQSFEKAIPFYRYRHLVRPGITGWAQVSQGYVASQEQTRVKLEFDLFYIRHQSFWLDLLIVAKTLRTILTGFGAR